MKLALLALCMLGAAGCSSPVSRNRDDSSSFVLREVEGRIEELDENVIELPPFPRPPGVPDAWISIVATAPAGFEGVTIRLRFRNADDREYRMLAANRGRLVRVSAKDGRGILSRGAIVFYSERKRRLELLDEPDRTSSSKVDRHE